MSGKYKYKYEDCEFFNVCKATCGGTLDDIEMCPCYELFKQLKRKEQKLKEIKEIVVPIKENTCFGMHCGAIDWILQTIKGEENV